ncbi:unnamed protein product [Orchesella dallaii]|uniref:Uncharacterized protein n=1 Tax=Orchesella dallaii TaxID=48710 RepID=A0ABP1RYU7_9HEXA
MTMTTNESDNYIFEFAPGSLYAREEDEKLITTPLDFGPIGSNPNKLRSKLRGSEKPSSDGLIPSLVSDFINDDGSLVGGRDLRGMVPMFPGREPPIQPKVTGDGDPVLDTVLHPHVIQIWNWLEPESSAKVPIFQLDKLLAQEQDMRVTSMKNTDPWISSRLRRSSLNSSTLSLSAKSSASSGYGSGYNSELQSPETDYQAVNNVPLRMSSVTGNTWFNRMAELCNPPSSSFSDFKVGQFEVSKKNQLRNIEKDPYAEKIVHSKPTGPIPQPLIHNENFVQMCTAPPAAWKSDDMHSPSTSQLRDDACTVLLKELEKMIPRKEGAVSQTVGAQLGEFERRYRAKGDKLRPRICKIPHPDTPDYNQIQMNNKATLYSPKEFVPQCYRGPIHQPPMSAENFNTYAGLNDARNYYDTQSWDWKLRDNHLGSNSELTTPCEETVASETSEADVVEKCGATSLRWPEISTFNQPIFPSKHQYSGQTAMTSSVKNSMNDNSQEFPLQSEKPFKSSDDPYAAAKVAWHSYDTQFNTPQLSYNPPNFCSSLDDPLHKKTLLRKVPIAKEYKDHTLAFINRYGASTADIRPDILTPPINRKYCIQFDFTT